MEEYCLVPFNPITIVFKYISLHKRKNCLWVRQRVILDAIRKGKLLLFRLINAHFYTTHIPWISNPLFPGWIEIYIMIYMYIYINTYTFICHKSTPYKDLGLTEKNTELMPLAKKEKNQAICILILILCMCVTKQIMSYCMMWTFFIQCSGNLK